MSENIYTDLPRVVEIIALSDAGEGGAATCPHCGALGRYVYHFIVEGGAEMGAMRGCFAHFPKSRYFAYLADILKKEQEARKRGRSIASWDVEIRDAARAHGEGRLTDAQVDEAIRRANLAKRAYMQRRGYR